ncbi:MAG TPA: biotin/lipoyl-binding protein, partial [Burkholderiales bacterium]
MTVPATMEIGAGTVRLTAPMHGLPGRQAPMPDADYGKAIRLGLWILGAGFGGFLAWAAFAPLDEGVPAPGVVSVESKRKHIDHLNGGIVEQILVREGEQVREGQELIVLNDTQAKAGLNAIESQWRVVTA